MKIQYAPLENRRPQTPHWLAYAAAVLCCCFLSSCATRNKASGENAIAIQAANNATTMLCDLDAVVLPDEPTLHEAAATMELASASAASSKSAKPNKQPFCVTLVGFQGQIRWEDTIKETSYRRAKQRAQVILREYNTLSSPHSVAKYATVDYGKCK